MVLRFTMVNMVYLARHLPRKVSLEGPRGLRSFQRSPAQVHVFQD